MATKILSIDPSGTGTTGIFFTNGSKQEFSEYKEKEWRKHYEFILSLVKLYQPNLLLFENTNFISNRTSDSLNLIRLLGAIETLPIKKIESINVVKVKDFTKKLLAFYTKKDNEMSKQLFKGIAKIEHLEYLPGRGKGWMFNKKRVSIHQLEAFLVWYLWEKA